MRKRKWLEGIEVPRNLQKLLEGPRSSASAKPTRLNVVPEKRCLALTRSVPRYSKPSL